MPTAVASPPDQGSASYRLGTKLDAAGNVYEAQHPRFPGPIAIKLFPRAIGVAPAAVTAFAREAGRISILRHPRIAQVVDSGVLPDRTPFVAMERLYGQTLEDLLLRRGPLGLPQAFAVIRDIVLGLSAAHEAGVVHREIRPDNIFLVGRADTELGFVKLLDFGVSQLTWAPHAGGRGISADGARYLAPEQVRRGLLGIDVRTDEFALAVLTYRMLRGPDPFLGPSIARASAVDTVLGQALRETPGERFPSVGHFFRAFEEAIISSVPTPAPTRTRWVSPREAAGDNAVTREVALVVDPERPPHQSRRDEVAVALPVDPGRPRPQSRREEVAVALPVAPERSRHPSHRDEVAIALPVDSGRRNLNDREGALAERFFEEGERHEQTRWKNAPAARETISRTPDITFTSFDRVPRRRKPLALVLTVAAIAGTGFAGQKLGWRSPRAVWDESSIGRTVYLFRAGLPWNQPAGLDVHSAEERAAAPLAPGSAPAPSAVFEPTGGVVPTGIGEPTDLTAPTEGVEPAGLVAPAEQAESTGPVAPTEVVAPTEAAAPAVVTSRPAGQVAPVEAPTAAQPSAIVGHHSTGGRPPAAPSPRKRSGARQISGSSLHDDRGSALRGYVWSPRAQRMVRSAR